jgi:tetratricopeptide (TPR) repeat protein
LKVPTEEQLQEIHRLAVLGDVAAIAQEVGPWLAGHWLATSRFREVRELSLQTLALGPHAGTLVHLAHAKQRLGEVQDALEHYGTALHLYTAVGDRAGLAITLNNLGLVYDGLGDRQQALHYYQQALPIREEVGDRAGESVTRYNMAMIYREQGQLAEAVAALRQVVALDEQVQHPDLESDRAVLRQVEQEWRESLQ